MFLTDKTEIVFWVSYLGLGSGGGWVGSGERGQKFSKQKNAEFRPCNSKENTVINFFKFFLVLPAQILPSQFLE